MGIPYSREINAAFEQVTPLVAAGFKVLRTTKNISILLAAIQVLTVLLLAFISILLIFLIYSLNPDLEAERQQLVTPIFQWLAGVNIWAAVRSVVVSVAVLGGLGVVAWLVWQEEQPDGVDADEEEAKRLADENADEGKKVAKGKKKPKKDEGKDEEGSNGKEKKK